MGVSAYPAAIDNYNDPTAGDNLNSVGVIHHDQHSSVNRAVNAIETELGLTPSGPSLTVADRLALIEAAIALKEDAVKKNAANGYAGLDAGAKLNVQLDAAKITSGTVPVARVPDLSGAKILGTGSGGAAIPVDAVPNLDVAKITTGIFNVLRIPNLDAAKITSGTIAAARLPSSVTANANAVVVADVAARDAIPLVDRANGKLVVVLLPFTMYAWRTDNSTWVQIGGPGYFSEPPLENYDGTLLTTSITTFSPGSPGQSIVFTAPQSGNVWISAGSLLIITVGTGQAYFSAEVRAGAVIGSGTVMSAAATTTGIGVGGTTGGRAGGNGRWLVSGLTPGNQYHARTMFTTSASPTATMQMFYRRLAVEMVH